MRIQFIIYRLTTERNKNTILFLEKKKKLKAFTLQINRFLYVTFSFFILLIAHVSIYNLLQTTPGRGIAGTKARSRKEIQSQFKHSNDFAHKSTCKLSKCSHSRIVFYKEIVSKLFSCTVFHLEMSVGVLTPTR